MTTLSVNGEKRSYEGDPSMPLLWFLRDELALTGTKYGCGVGLCGACTVHLDGEAVRSCVLPIGRVGPRAVTTIEAISTSKTGTAVQKAWLDHEVVQCGYCQSGQIMSATALLEHNAHPDDAAIETAMSGNICRCATYTRIRTAIKSVQI